MDGFKKKIDVKIVTKEEIDDADDIVVVCVPADYQRLFDDDVFTNCDICGQRIKHRPDAPAGRRICLACVPQLTEGEDVGEVSITPKTAEEFAELLKKMGETKQ